jgi:hypothetical protein
MSEDSKPENHRRLVDMIADAMSHAITSGREEFAEHLGSIRDLVVDAEVDAGYDRRPADELNEWMKQRYGKTKKRIPTSRLT